MISDGDAAHPPVYIILLSYGIGGAEKRFTENWIELRKAGHPVHLVISRLTHDMLHEQPGMEILAQHIAYIHVFDSASRRYGATVRAVWPIIKAIPPRAIVHYPLAYVPLMALLKRQTLIISWVNVAIPSMKSWRDFKRVVVPWMSFWEASKLDVLNPNNLARLKQHRFIQRKLSLTKAGTFVDFTRYVPSSERENAVVFLGRLEREKNALAFVQRIPAIAERLRVHGIAVPRFYIIGNGAEETQIRQLVSTDPYSGLDVVVQYTNHPASILSRAKVFLSLQRTSNYPSKALAEAMACGCVPLITDVGESRLMIDDALATYIDPALIPEQMAAGIAEVLGMTETRFTQLSQAIHLHARSRFSIEEQAQYFAQLYGFL